MPAARRCAIRLVVAEAAAVVIRSGSPGEGPRLKEIAIAAKGFWGYEPAKVREWANQGDFTPERLGELIVFVAESDGVPIGWASLVPKDGIGSATGPGSPKRSATSKPSPRPSS